MPDTDQPQQDQDRQRRRDELLALLLGLAFIHDGDIDAARVLWEQHSQPAYTGLLGGSGKYRFDPATQLYTRESTGRALGSDELKRISINFAQGVGRDVIEPEAAKLAQNPVPDEVEKWALETARDVKDAAIAEAALAAGGFELLTPELRERIIGERDVGPGLEFTLDRLANFASDIEEHAPRADSESAIIYRAGLYPKAQNSLFEDVKRESHKRASDPKGRPLFIFERNILGPAENHCVDGPYTEGCIETTEAGWQPIGSLPLPGLRTCQSGCLCQMIFSLSGPAEDN